MDPVRKRLEALERADPVERAHDFGVRRIGMSEPDVLGDRSAEEMSLLRQHHDPPVERIERRVAEVDFAERDLTPDWVVLTRQQFRERRLSGAGRSDERNVLARLERQRDAAHNRT